MNKIKSVMFLPAGGTAVFDDGGQQMPELQESWLLLWAKHAESLGYDVTEIKEILLPSGMSARLIKTEDGYNWRLLPPV